MDRAHPPNGEAAGSNPAWRAKYNTAAASAVGTGRFSSTKGSEMNELNEEIKLTINTMQCDIDDGAHGELQSHLYSLLEIKRNELQQRLVERSWVEPVTHDEAKPLTTEELKAGGWCVDSSEECWKALVEKGLDARGAGRSIGEGYKYCYLAGTIVVMMPMQARNTALKQIHLIGNDFYWSKK